MKILNKQAFTLVELIVVITILAILGTIAFISLQGYSRDSRDGARIADLNSIQKSLEIYITEKGIYPVPDEEANISYSGGLAWIEGTVGDGVIRNLSKINKKPLDPLTGNEYTYSITSGKTEYQLGAIKEGGLIGYELPLNQTYAATEKKAIAMIRGTYNERFLKVKSGSLNWLVAMPTIITADIRELDLQGQLNNKLLVYGNYGNLPHSYNNLGFAMNGGFDYTNTNPLVYSGSMKSLLEDENKLIFIDALKEAYNGTIIQGEPNYQDIVNTNTGTNQTGAIYLVNNFINTDVGGINPGNVVLPINTTTSINNPPETVGCTLDSTEISTLNGLVSTASINAYDSYWNQLYPSNESEWCNDVSIIAWDGGSSVPSELWKLTNLTYLALENNSISTLSSEIGNLTNLTELRLNGNSFNSLPSELWGLTNLTELRLNGNSLTSLPEGIGNLTNLTTLNLTSTSLSTLPTELSNLNNLEYLYLSDNTSLGYLSEDFYISSSNLFQENIPTVGQAMTIGGDGNKINISINSMGCINPTELNTLNGLVTSEDIDVYDSNSNVLNSPLTLTQWCEDVIDLDWYGGSLVPQEIWKLNNLQQLDLSNNNIVNLPAEIGNLTNLKGLYVYRNELTYLPAEIGNLSNLTRLFIAYNQISDLPSELWDLTNLEDLFVGPNQVSYLSSEISNLTKLKNLSLYGNYITEIPSEVWGLTNLIGLFFDNNQILYLSTEIGNLTNLTRLTLSNCNLSEIPSEVWGLTDLYELNLSNNQLSSLSSEIGNLTNLTDLNLSNNQLVNIPSTISNINLYGNVGLNLSYNLLENLPPEITNFSNLSLHIIDLTGNGLLGSSATLFDDNSSEICNNIGTNGENICISGNGMSIQVNTYTNTSCMTQTAYDNLKNYISSESLYVYDFPYGTLLTTSSSMSDFCTAQSAYWYGGSFLPDELWVMTSLTQLDLSNNSINYLSESIGNLTVLNTLSLDNNTLSELPSSIGNLSSLQELRVSNNQLSSLPSEIGYLTSLYRLELANNNLSNLPTEMTYLQLLLYLDLSNNLALGNLSYVFDYSYPMEIKIGDNLTITCGDYNNIVISPNN